MSCSSSLIGVSSIYHKNTPTTPLQNKPHLKSALRIRNNGVNLSNGSFVASATATPNSILSEKAFKGLGVFDEESEFSDENGSENEEDELVSESDDGVDDGDELAINNLGLPQRLVQSLEKREITRLFPIQVWCLFLYFMFVF